MEMDNNLIPLVGSGEVTRPSAVGAKFDETGKVRTFKGNTIICNVDHQCDLYTALIDVHEALDLSKVKSSFSYLPPESFHMTLFDGLLDQFRQTGIWPLDLPMHLPFSEVNEIFAERLNNIDIPYYYKMRPVELGFMRGGGAVIYLEPADEANRKYLHSAREKLSTLLKIRKPNHDSYRFHISLSYLIDWLSPEQATSYFQYTNEIFEEFNKKIVDFEIGPPEFCSFDDMYYFKPLLQLG